MSVWKGAKHRGRNSIKSGVQRKTFRGPHSYSQLRFTANIIGKRIYIPTNMLAFVTFCSYLIFRIKIEIGIGTIHTRPGVHSSHADFFFFLNDINFLHCIFTSHWLLISQHQKKQIPILHWQERSINGQIWNYSMRQLQLKFNSGISRPCKPLQHCEKIYELLLTTAYSHSTCR